MKVLTKKSFAGKMNLMIELLTGKDEGRKFNLHWTPMHPCKFQWTITGTGYRFIPSQFLRLIAEREKAKPSM
jgi:hypothetical protein